MFNPRKFAAFLHDVLAAAVAWLFAFALSFNFEIPADFLTSSFAAMLWVLPTFALLFFFFGLYRGLWRFASLTDLQHLLSAVGIGTATTGLIVVLFHIPAIPTSVLVLYPILLSLLMGGSRFAYRSWKEHRLYGPTRLRGQPVIVLGAGESANSLIREINRSGQWYAVAIITDALEKNGLRLQGLPVYSPLNLVAELANRYETRHVIIAMPNTKAATRRQAAELAASAGLTVLTMPSYDDLLTGRLSVSSIRKIELEDLLGREEVQLDDEGLHRLLTGRTVLISGAGGSIGSELCRQISGFSPGKLVLVDSSEFALYTIDEELKIKFPTIQSQCWAADVRDSERISEIFQAEHPCVVFHAAAYKHVPLMEDVNSWEAVRTNALGTLLMAKAASSHQVEKFVLISTDKAVNPTSVMGASKRLAELLCQAVQQESNTSFITVRFGNVLGSNGSVIPKFREQITRGGPVTVTHPDIVRYFMTIPEAAQLVLQAGLMGSGGEIFVMDMGEPVRIADLARDMIRLSGYSENEITIVFSGLRPGEKLYEELLANNENTLKTPHPKLRIAQLKDPITNAEFESIKNWLSSKTKTSDSTKKGLSKFITEYQTAR